MPLRVELLFDVSGSMRELRSEANWNLAGDLLSAMPPDSEVGLEFFSKDLEPVVRPTTNRKALLDQVEGLRSRKSTSGKTALWADR
jgi:von Willebrand factor type A domain